MSDHDRAPLGHLRIGGWLPRPRAMSRSGGSPPAVAHTAAAPTTIAPAAVDPAAAGHPGAGEPFAPDDVPRLDLDDPGFDDDTAWEDGDDAFDRPPVWYRRTPYAILASFLVVIVVVVAAVRLLSTPGAPDADDHDLARVPTRQFIPAPEPPGLESRSTAPGGGAASSAPSGGAASTAGPTDSPGPRPGAGGPATGQPTGPGPTSPPPVTAPPATAVSYEAEASGNVMSGSAWTHTVTGASGGKVVSVGWIGGMLRFTGITASAGGKYTLTIDYLCDQQRTAVLKVNGGSESTVTFASSGGTTRVASLAVTVTLKAGANTLEFSNPGGWAPDFDRITVR